MGSLQLVPFLELACHCKPRDFLFCEIFAGDCSDNMKMGDGWRYCSGWWHLLFEKDSEGHDARTVHVMEAAPKDFP